MGRFQCVQCRCSYHSKRFFWEEDEDTDAESETQASEASAERGNVRRRTYEQWVESDDEWEVNSTLQEDNEVKTTPSCEVVHFDPFDWGDSLQPAIRAEPKPVDGPSHAVFFDPFADMRGSISTDHVKAGAPLLSSTLVSADDSTWGVLEVGVMAEENDSDEETKFGAGLTRQDIAVHADAVRAIGTAAKITGSVAPVLRVGLAPFSVVGGAVGAVAGAVQLHRGLDTESGLVDPHLVTKGGVTATVGTTCMALGVGAAFAPGGGLFVAALVLGVTGFATATAVDCTMDGLCENCRQHAQNEEQHPDDSRRNSAPATFCSGEKRMPVVAGDDEYD